MNGDSGNEYDGVETSPSFRSYYQLLLSRGGRGASGSFRPRRRDKKSNDYRPRYCERASIVATDADKRWKEYNPLVSSGSPADDGSQCFLPTSGLSSPLHFLRLGIFAGKQFRALGGTHEMRRFRAIPKDIPVFIFPRVPFNDRQRGCDNSPRIIAPARN